MRVVRLSQPYSWHLCSSTMYRSVTRYLFGDFSRRRSGLVPQRVKCPILPWHLDPWRCGHYVIPKCQEPMTQRCSATSRKNGDFRYLIFWSSESKRYLRSWCVMATEDLWSYSHAIIHVFFIFGLKFLFTPSNLIPSQSVLSTPHFLLRCGSLVLICPLFCDMQTHIAGALLRKQRGCAVLTF